MKAGKGRTILVSAAALLVAALAGAPALAGDMPAAKDPTTSGRAADFEKIKKLAGEWTRDGEGDQVAVTYKVTGAGTAVVETLFPGAPFEMVTVYHMDGKDLMLTHYCGNGNQPRMKAAAGAAGASGGPVMFKFAGATGMKSPKAEHMHEMTMTFIDDDHVQASWTSFSGGKKSDVKEIKLTRKKA